MNVFAVPSEHPIQSGTSLSWSEHSLVSKHGLGQLPTTVCIAGGDSMTKRRPSYKVPYRS